MVFALVAVGLVAFAALVLSWLTLHKVGGLHALLAAQITPATVMRMLTELTRDVRHLTERVGHHDKALDDHEARIQQGVTTSNNNLNDIREAVQQEGAKTRSGMRDIVKPLVETQNRHEKWLLELETKIPERP